MLEAEQLLTMRDVQRAPLELWWRTLQSAGLCPLRLGCGWFYGRGPLYFWHYEFLTKRDCFSLVVRASTRLTSGSSSLFVEEGLLSRCDVLGASTLIVPGKSTSVLAKEPLHHFVYWRLFLLQASAPVKL